MPGRAQQLEYLDGPRAEQDMVAECPPAVHPEEVRVGEHHAERRLIAMDVGDNSQLRERSPHPAPSRHG